MCYIFFCVYGDRVPPADRQVIRASLVRWGRDMSRAADSRFMCFELLSYAHINNSNKMIR